MFQREPSCLKLFLLILHLGEHDWIFIAMFKQPNCFIAIFLKLLFLMNPSPHSVENWMIRAFSLVIGKLFQLVNLVWILSNKFIKIKCKFCKEEFCWTILTIIFIFKNYLIKMNSHSHANFAELTIIFTFISKFIKIKCKFCKEEFDEQCLQL